MDVPDPERRRAENAALTESIEELRRHYAPSEAQVEDCWEVRGGGGRVALRVSLTGPMRGSWTDAASGGHGDALDLVGFLLGLDATGALAEAERFLGRKLAGPEPRDGDGGSQMGLFGALSESRGRKRPSRRSGKARNAGTSRQAAAKHGPHASDPAPRPGDDTAGAGDAAGGSQASPDAPTPGGRNEAPIPADPVQNARPDRRGSGHPAPDPEGVGFTPADRQRLHKAADDAAWLRSRQTVRSLDADHRPGWARSRTGRPMSRSWKSRSHRPVPSSRCGSGKCRPPRRMPHPGAAAPEHGHRRRSGSVRFRRWRRPSRKHRRCNPCSPRWCSRRSPPSVWHPSRIPRSPPLRRNCRRKVRQPCPRRWRCQDREASGRRKFRGRL